MSSKLKFSRKAKNDCMKAVDHLKSIGYTDQDKIVVVQEGDKILIVPLDLYARMQLGLPCDPIPLRFNEDGKPVPITFKDER